jgi:hypothetical protein
MKKVSIQLLQAAIDVMAATCVGALDAGPATQTSCLRVPREPCLFKRFHRYADGNTTLREDRFSQRLRKPTTLARRLQ